MNKFIDISELEIESGIEKPPPAIPGRKKGVYRGGPAKKGKWIVLFSTMEIGDSIGIACENEEDLKRKKRTLYAAIQRFKTESENEPQFAPVKVNWKFSIRTLFLKMEVRVWRDE